MLRCPISYRCRQGVVQGRTLQKRVDGWFISREIVYKKQESLVGLSKEMRAAKELEAILNELPLSISDHAIFAGSQSDAFARSYALINPSFRVETFSGYCDPTAVYDDIEPNEEFTPERIARVREFTKNSAYIRSLSAMYEKYENYTEEVAFFIEQVTGHIIPDFRPALKYGINAILSDLDQKRAAETDIQKKDNYAAMQVTLKAVLRLAERYAIIAEKKQKWQRIPERNNSFIWHRLCAASPPTAAILFLKPFKPICFCGRLCAWSRRPIPLPSQ